MKFNSNKFDTVKFLTIEKLLIIDSTELLNDEAYDDSHVQFCICWSSIPLKELNIWSQYIIYYAANEGKIWLHHLLLSMPIATNCNADLFMQSDTL